MGIFWNIFTVDLWENFFFDFFGSYKAGPCLKETFDTLSFIDSNVIPDAVLVEDDLENDWEVVQKDEQFSEIVDIDYKK